MGKISKLCLPEGECSLAEKKENARPTDVHDRIRPLRRCHTTKAAGEEKESPKMAKTERGTHWRVWARKGLLCKKNSHSLEAPQLGAQSLS